MKTCMAEKTKIRLVAPAAHQKRHIVHFDIKAVYLHEPYRLIQPEYIREPRRLESTISYPMKMGLLPRNLYCTPPAAHTYHQGLVKHIAANGNQQSRTDPFLFTKKITRNLYCSTIHTAWGSLIAWNSAKKEIVTRSTCDAEYIVGSASIQKRRGSNESYATSEL